MTEQRKKYVPNGTPLTDREREILIVLMEECAEVTQAASKLLRFGKENRPVDGLNNSLVLSAECGDLRRLLDMVREAGITDHEIETVHYVRKAERLLRFMQH